MSRKLADPPPRHPLRDDAYDDVVALGGAPRSQIAAAGQRGSRSDA